MEIRGSERLILEFISTIFLQEYLIKCIPKIALFVDRHLFFKNNISYDLEAENFEFTPFMASLNPLANTDSLPFSIPPRVDRHCQVPWFLRHCSSGRRIHMQYPAWVEIYVDEAQFSRSATALLKYHCRRENKVEFTERKSFYLLQCNRECNRMCKLITFTA